MIVKGINRASEAIMNEDFSRWKGAQEGESSEEDESMPLTVLRSLSKSIARKRNFVSAEVVYQRLERSTDPLVQASCGPSCAPES